MIELKEITRYLDVMGAHPYVQIIVSPEDQEHYKPLLNIDGAGDQYKFRMVTAIDTPMTIQFCGGGGKAGARQVEESEIKQYFGK